MSLISTSPSSLIPSIDYSMEFGSGPAVKTTVHLHGIPCRQIIFISRFPFENFSPSSPYIAHDVSLPVITTNRVQSLYQPFFLSVLAIFTCCMLLLFPLILSPVFRHFLYRSLLL